VYETVIYGVNRWHATDPDSRLHMAPPGLKVHAREAPSSGPGEIEYEPIAQGTPERSRRSRNRLLIRPGFYSAFRSRIASAIRCCANECGGTQITSRFHRRSQSATPSSPERIIAGTFPQYANQHTDAAARDPVFVDSPFARSPRCGARVRPYHRRAVRGATVPFSRLQRMCAA